MILAAAALLLLASTPAIPLDELVKKLGESEVASEAAFKQRACTITIDSRELDKHGGVKSKSEIVMSRTFVDGKERDELVRYVEDGKDVTEEKKKARAEREKKESAGKKEEGDDGNGIRSPFHPEKVASYEFEDLGADPADPALRRIGFKPKRNAKAGDDLMIGSASVTADGRVSSMRVSPADLPPLVSVIDIAAAFGDAGQLTKLELSGEAGALFLKKRFRMVTTFDWL